MAEEKIDIVGLFPSPVYITHREMDLDLTEEKEIRDIINEGMSERKEIPFVSRNMYIFDTRLYNLKEFCEKHIKIYVKEIINPKEKLDFYITQSWLNVITPNNANNITEFPKHSHANSIISGVFYISTKEEDSIRFYDENVKVKEWMRFNLLENNIWNSNMFSQNVDNNTLVLFPSWLEHSAENFSPNRISLAFNVFAKGLFGTKNTPSELIL
jgi:uncharacterized protein (TIGR02466 family)